ncbi:MAG: SprT family zinc-dependent metalloprotease [Parvibaculum sp.]
MKKTTTSRALHMDMLTLGSEQVPLVVRHNPRARRFIVRVDMTSGAVHVTTPNKRNVKGALAFARGHADWIAAQRNLVPTAEPFCTGAKVPVRGVMHTIRHIAGDTRSAGGRRRVVTQNISAETGDAELLVVGDVAFLSRRVADWLKAQAKADLNQAVLAHASKLDVRPSRITVRDQSSRWGSCSSTRALSFSWRLILTPPRVLDYVAAHEVAHLRHMNHGLQFWKTVAQLMPDYRGAIRWLETEGPALHRFGSGNSGGSAGFGAPGRPFEYQNTKVIK